jgi:hypothetical protein
LSFHSAKLFLPLNFPPQTWNSALSPLAENVLDKEIFAYHRCTKKFQVILDDDHMLHEMSLPLLQTDISIEPLYRISFHDLSWNFFD